jgi:lipopolysaccharide biosynthesis regulator YciM
MLGDMAMADGDIEEAIACWKRVEQQDPAYLSLVAERIVEAYRKLGQPEEGVRVVRDFLSRYPSLDLLNAAFDGELDLNGAKAASELVREELMRHPTLLGLDKLLEVQLIDAPTERRNDLELIRSLIHQHTRSLALYRCDVCGFKARQFYWHCPACNGWETYPPRRSEEQEVMG